MTDSPATPVEVSFGSHRVWYAGDLEDGWFVSRIDEPDLLKLDHAGSVIDRFACPAVNRAVRVDGRLIGLRWDYAWGRRWGYLGGEPETTAYDVETGKQLWSLEGGVSALVGKRMALGRDAKVPDAPTFLFDILTGERAWSLSVGEAAFASDDHFVYALERDGAIRALELRTGAELWKVEPSDGRRVEGNLCRVLVPQGDCLWYAAHPRPESALLLGLSRETGEPAVEIPFEGWVENLLATERHLLVIHELGVARLSGTVVEPVVGDLPDQTAAVTDGRGLAVMSGGATLLWTDDVESSAPGRAKLAVEGSHLRAAGGFATLRREKGFLRWPLAMRVEKGAIHATRVVAGTSTNAPLEPATVVFAGPSLVMVEHPTRGRFTMKVADTGLKAGASVQLGGFTPGPMNTQMASILAYPGPDGALTHARVGEPGGDGSAEGASGEKVEVAKVQAPKSRRPPKAIEKLVTTLRELELIPELSEAEVRKLGLRLRGGTAAERTARLLQQLHGETRGLSFGFLSHDWSFGQETEDVIAEFAECLQGEPLTLAQIESRPGALHIQWTIREQVRSEWVEVDDEGLDAVVRFLNGRLEEAGAARRIFPLKTDGDWHAYIVRRPAEVEQMIERGVGGLSLPRSSRR